MGKRRIGIDDLVDIFRGKLDENRPFFERVMSGSWRNPGTGRPEDRSDAVIPYRSVIEFYVKELAHAENAKQAAAELAAKRKRPISEEQKQVLRDRLAKIRAAKVRD